MSAWTDALAVAEAHVDGVVESLTAQRDAASASLAQTTASLDAAEASLTALTAERDAARAERDTALAAAAAATQAANEAAAQARPRRTVFGGCPSGAGGTSLAAAASVVSKYGSGSCVRQFFGGWQPPNFPAGAALVHASYAKSSIDIRSILDGSQDAAITAWAAGIVPPPGVTCVVEWMHEGDKKVSDGYCSLGDAVAAKSRFYDVVKAANPALLVANTLTGWIFDTRSSAHGTLSEWGRCRADVLGADFDGIRPTVLPYPNFSPAQVAKVQEVVAAAGYRHWAVPEFGAPRISGDDGTVRAQWMLDTGTRFAAADALYVAMYEYDSTPGYKLTAPLEVSAIRALAV